jgi:hypothetical protein
MWGLGTLGFYILHVAVRMHFDVGMPVVRTESNGFVEDEIVTHVGCVCHWILQNPS